MTSSAVLLTPIVVVLLLAGSALWVYRDASIRAAHDTPVTFSAGSFEVSAPVVWAAGCLVLWVVFMPLYLTCRNRAG